jgi:hypothetical protein
MSVVAIIPCMGIKPLQGPFNKLSQTATLYTYIRILPLLVLMIATVPLATASELLPAFEATLTIRYGPLSGTMTLRLSHCTGGYIYETSLQPKGFASLFKSGIINETTYLETVGETVRPLDYASTDTIANPVRTTHYVFDQDRVSGVYKSQPVDVPMLDGGHNRISAHIAMMMALQSGVDLPGFAIFDRARWREFEFEVIPNQVTKTKSGTFDTVEVRYSPKDSDKGSSLYFASSLSYLPVMIVYREGGKVKSRAQLTEYRIDTVDGRPPVCKAHNDQADQ